MKIDHKKRTSKNRMIYFSRVNNLMSYQRTQLISKIDITRLSITILVLATLIVITSRTVADPDLWGHLRFGLDTLESGRIIHTDPYSYLSVGQHWINHEWLAEVIFALAWQAGKTTGLVLLKTTLGVLTLGLIYIYLLKLDFSPIRVGSLVILASLAVFPTIATIRPHIFTLLFTVIIFIIIAYAESGKYRYLWVAPPIFVLWVNFHGGFLAGLGFLGIWTMSHTIINRREWLHIIPPVLLSFLAVLLNPYGLDLILFLLRTATIQRPEIVEWQSIQLFSFLGAVYLILLSITVIGLVFSRCERRIPLLILLGVAAVLPFNAVRHLPLFALSVLIFAGVHIFNAWLQFTNESKGPSRLPNWVSVLTFIAAIFLLGFSYSSFSTIKMPLLPTPFFPKNSVSLIKESEVSGNMAVEFNWGEYVIWHLSPEIKVSMDGRRETVYPDEIYDTNLSFQYGINDWDSLLDDYETDLALVQSSQAAYNLIKMKPEWILVYEDLTSSLFASQNWSQINTLKQTAEVFDNLTTDGQFP